MKIAITGANSSVGRTLLRHVADRADVQAIACVRSDLAAATIPVSPNVSSRVVPYEDREQLIAAFAGVDAVVHLAGILLESGTSTYQTANVDATRVVVDACRAAGVRHLVLVSVLAANEHSPNRYLRSKGVAERIVRESRINATIIRTPILLGPGTAGGRALVQVASRASVRLLGGGHHVTRPLDVDDLSRAILHRCRNPGEDVAVHELVGPEPVAYRDVVARTARLMGKEVSVGSMPVWLARSAAAAAACIRRGGMTPTVINVITSSEHVERNADVDLGVSLTPLSTTLEKLLHSNGEARHQ